MKILLTDKWITISFSQYDFRRGNAKLLVEEIKQIPYNFRSYNRETQEWTVANLKEFRDMIKLYDIYSFDTEEGNKHARDFLKQFYV